MVGRGSKMRLGNKLIKRVCRIVHGIYDRFAGEVIDLLRVDDDEMQREKDDRGVTEQEICRARLERKESHAQRNGVVKGMVVQSER